MFVGLERLSDQAYQHPTIVEGDIVANELIDEGLHCDLEILGRQSRDAPIIQKCIDEGRNELCSACRADFEEKHELRYDSRHIFVEK